MDENLNGTLSDARFLKTYDVKCGCYYRKSYTNSFDVCGPTWLVNGTYQCSCICDGIVYTEFKIIDKAHLLKQMIYIPGGIILGSWIGIIYIAVRKKRNKKSKRKNPKGK